MADIAFLLLVFFLVTTTMDSEWGLPRRLPPPILEDLPPPPPIKDRNVFVVLANANDQLLVEGELMDISELKEAAKEFIANPNRADDLPEFKVVDIP
ncbi:MAG: biopolymer transporter ExbD, partial [Bacteroidota bacterium]